MLKLDPILNIYEKSKLLLMEGGEPGQKEQYVKEMDEYCEKILDQLNQRTEN